MEGKTYVHAVFLGGLVKINVLRLENQRCSAKKFTTFRPLEVNLPEPLGPKLFILGEPVLHRTWDFGKCLPQDVGRNLDTYPLYPPPNAQMFLVFSRI